MAEDRVIKFTLSDGSQALGIETLNDSPTASIDKIIQQVQHPMSTIAVKIMEQKIGPNAANTIAQAGSTAYNMVKQIAFTEANRYFSLKEDYISQNALNVAMQGMSNMQSVATTVVGSAVAGAKTMGVIGLVGGLAFGTVLSAVKVQLNKAQKTEQYQMQLAAVNTQVSFGESRASLVNGGHSTEN